MKLSRDWLNDYIDLSDLSDDELAQRFTSIGHAVESVERHGDDTVFDLEITANRVDAMSHLELARELAAAGFGAVRFVRLSQRAELERADALARIRGRHISTFDLIGDEEYAAGLERAERQLPGRIDYKVDWLIAVAERGPALAAH